MNSTERLIKARTHLILDAPFFGALLLRLQMIPDESVSTFCTNGREIRYSEKFLSTLSDAELKGVIVHEVAHCALGHIFRIGHRALPRWNQATDYAINQLLEDYAEDCRNKRESVPWQLPKGGLLNPAYREKSSEEIYDLLPEDNGDAPPSPGEFIPAASGADGKGEVVEDEWKIAVSQAAQAAKARGKCPDSIRRMVEEILNPKVPWRDVLREFLRTPARDDYSWSRPNCRYAGTGFILPSLRNERVGRIVIAVDTSGSIGPKELAEFRAEVQGCLDETEPEAIEVIYCDAEIAGIEEFIPGDTVILNAKGGGGTDFRPVFDHCDNADDTPVAVVYLTDGYGEFPEKEPSYPVLWAFTNDHVEAPFGDSVLIA